MPVYQINQNTARLLKPMEFQLEKDLQQLVESNLQTIFNCRLVATEFSTGNIHAGRIDTLAISEDNNPVIIEYKKLASSELINQSLYYLHWIKDHKGDFQLAVNKALAKHTEVDWSEIRVICIAPEYKKYDLHAVQVMGANIELWQYGVYDQGIFQLEEVYRSTQAASSNQEDGNGKNPVMVEAGRKAAITRKTGVYSVDEHMLKTSAALTPVFEEIRNYILRLGESIEETPKRYYISYKTSQNFACLEVQRQKLCLFLKINADELHPLPPQCRDVRNIGHFGTGDLELTIKSLQDFEETKELINLSLKNIGG